MSKKIVLDAYTFVDAFGKDSWGVLATLVKVCDQIVLNERILEEYAKYSFVSAILPLPKLQQLRQMRPPKVLTVEKPQKGTIQPPRSHRELFEGALKGRAQIVISSMELRGKWAKLSQTLAHV